MHTFYLLILVLSILSGCGKKAIPSVKNEVKEFKQASVLRQFRAEIEGVECAVCAQDAMDTIKTMEGVDCVDFILTTTDYEEGYVSFRYDMSEKNIDIRLLDDLLQKQDFELTWLQGTFHLEPFSSDGKKYVALTDEVAMPFCFNNNVDLLKQMLSSHPEKLFATGIIKKDPQEGNYFFTLLGQG